MANRDTDHNKNVGLTDTAFGQAIEYLYRAPVESAAWLLFFDLCSNLLQCAGGQYLILESTGEVSFSALSKTLEQIVHGSTRRWICPHLFSLLANRKDKRTLFHYDFVAQTDLDRVFFRESGMRYITALRQFGPHSTISILAWFARGDQSPINGDRLNWLERIQSDFERVSRLHAEMICLRHRLSQRERILDRLGYPILLVDETGLIRFSNPAAESWQAVSGSFCFRHHYLAGRDKGSQAALDLLLRRSKGMDSYTIHTVPRPCGGKPYQMMILPLRPAVPAEDPPRSALTLILIGDPQACNNLTVEDLRITFGFTSAEARVALGLSEGRTLEEIAEEGGVSINTIRSQLRQALEKTGSCRQAELLRTVTALPRLR